MIPIKNLYYLLLYAWDALDELDTGIVDAEPETSVLDLLANILNRGIDRLLRQGFDRSYLPFREQIPGIRGKIDLSATVKADLLRSCRTVCEFDELSHDVLHNQILKATVRLLLRHGDLDGRIREPLRVTWHRLHEVSNIQLTDRSFRCVRLHRNNRSYRFLLDVCQLIHKNLIPNRESGQFVFRSFVDNDRRMRSLFERFVRNFFRCHAENVIVSAEQIFWKDAIGSAEDLSYLPTMRTDVSLRRPGEILVIDAKYYTETLQSYRQKSTVRSSHLYQLLAYLSNIRTEAEPDTRIEGLLLYPETTRRLQLNYEIQGYRIRVYTLNLNQPWQSIHANLLDLLN